MAFWQGVMDNLESAYRAAVQNTVVTHRMSSGQFGDMQPTVGDKLTEVLSQLAREEQVGRWHAEAAWRNQTAAGQQGLDVETRDEQVD